MLLLLFIPLFRQLCNQVTPELLLLWRKFGDSVKWTNIAWNPRLSLPKFLKQEVISLTRTKG